MRREHDEQRSLLLAQVRNSDDESLDGLSTPTTQSEQSEDEQQSHPLAGPSSGAGPSGAGPSGAAGASEDGGSERGERAEQPNPSPMYLIQGPDGSMIGIAVDPNAPKPPEPPPEEPSSRLDEALDEARLRAAMQLLRAPLPEAADEDPYIHLEYALYLRRRRSFLFLLCFELSYYSLCLVTATALLGRSGGPSSFLQCLVFLVPVAVDCVGFFGAVKKKPRVMTVFVLLEGVSIGVGAFEELSIMIMIRLLILVLSMQVREGMLRWRALEESYFRTPPELELAEPTRDIEV